MGTSQLGLGAAEPTGGQAGAGDGGGSRLMHHHAPLAVLLQEALELALWRQPAGAQVHAQLVEQACGAGVVWGGGGWVGA